MLIKLKGLDGTDLYMESRAVVAIKRQVSPTMDPQEWTLLFMSGDGDPFTIGMRLEEVVKMIYSANQENK